MEKNIKTGKNSYLIHTDGGARGNPGPAAMGVVKKGGEGGKKKKKKK